MVKAMGLIFSLFDVALSQDVPLAYRSMYNAYTSWTYLCPPLCPIFLLTAKGVDSQ